MQRIAGYLVVCSLLTGCVALPHPVTPDVSATHQVEVFHSVQLSPEANDTSTDFSKQVADLSDNIEIVDVTRLRDIAFADEDWNLDELMQPATRQRIMEELDLQYVVILGELKRTYNDDEGSFYIPFVVGAVAGEELSSLSAIIVDLKEGEAISKIDSVAHSTQRLFIYVIVAVGNMPLTRSSAIKGLAEETARIFDDIAESKTLRIAVINERQEDP